MKRVNLLWVSRNNKWAIYLAVHPRTNKLGLEVTDGYISQIPIFYDNGGFAFDNPYGIPKYVIEKVRVLGYKLKKQGVLYKEAQ